MQHDFGAVAAQRATKSHFNKLPWAKGGPGL